MIFQEQQVLLSKQRTILSFMRTGLAFIAAGIAIAGFFRAGTGGTVRHHPQPRLPPLWRP